MTRTAVSAKATQTSATNNSSIDISAITGDWTLVITVFALTGTCRLAIQDSVDAFTTPLGGPHISFSGTIASSYPKRYTFTKKDFPDLRFGVTSAVLRSALTAITASTGTITYQVDLEY